MYIYNYILRQIYITINDSTIRKLRIRNAIRYYGLDFAANEFRYLFLGIERCECSH